VTARADTIAFGISGGSPFGASAPLPATFGYAFTASSPILVTHFGLFDLGNDGFSPLAIQS
jgi:hypothetical protein